MTIGERIRDCRKEKKMTLEELSRETGIPKSTIQRWESGAIRNMGQAGLLKIAEAMGTTVSYLQTGVSVNAAIQKKPPLDEEIVFDYLARKCGYYRNYVPEKRNLYYIRRESVVRTDADDIRRLVEEAASYMAFLMERKSFPLAEFLDELRQRETEESP